MGCGTYSWNIQPPKRDNEPVDPPKTPLAVGERKCNDETEFGNYRDVHGNDVLWAAMGLCGSQRETEIGPGDKYPGDKEAVNMNGRWKQSQLHASVKWKAGCRTDVEKQKVGNPLGTVTDGTPMGGDPCITEVYKNWKECELHALTITFNVQFAASY